MKASIKESAFWISKNGTLMICAIFAAQYLNNTSLSRADEALINDAVMAHLDSQLPIITPSLEKAVGELAALQKQLNMTNNITNYNQEDILSIEQQLAALNSAFAQIDARYYQADKKPMTGIISTDSKSDADSIEQMESELFAQTQSYDDAVYSEPNSSWASEVEVKIQDALSEEGMHDFDLVEHACGEAVCRTQVVLDDMDDKLDEIDELMSVMADRGEGRMQFDSKTSMVTFHYAKEGESLPHMAEN
ncbi:MAG: hypothetical protein KUG83_04480 [Gammaproteobacteria bacterium]|nr:hypothetical protein [Gammaproteobacteria bacterium]